MGCEGKFTKVVDIDLPEQTDLLTAIANWDVDQDSLTVIVSASKSILDESQVFDIFPDANVGLYADDALVEVLEYDSLSQRFLLRGGAINWQPGVNYGLKVDQAGFEQITASAQLAVSPTVRDVTCDLDGGVDFDFGDRIPELTFTFDDPVGADYYKLEVRLLYLDSGTGSSFFDKEPAIETNDPQLFGSFTKYSDPDRGLFFRDSNFEGKTVTLRVNPLLSFNVNSDDYRYFVKLIRVSKALYEYEQSIDLFYENDGNPFAEPIVIGSNFENGYGIFAISRGEEIEFEVE